MKPPDRRSWTSLLGEVKPERAVVHRLCRQVEEPRFALKSCFSRRVERCEQISQYRPRQRPNPECFALPPGLIGRSRREASPFAKSGGDHCGVGADLAGEDLVEQVWAPAFEPSQRRRSGRAGGAKTVDIAFRVINGFWSSWGAAVLAVGVEDLADPNDRLWRAGSLPRMDYRGPRPAALEGPPLVGRNGASRPDAFQT